MQTLHDPEIAIAMTPNTTTRPAAVRASDDDNLREALLGPSAAWVAAALAQADMDPLAAAIDAASVARVLIARAAAFLSDEQRARDRDASGAVPTQRLTRTSP